MGAAFQCLIMRGLELRLAQTAFAGITLGARPPSPLDTTIFFYKSKITLKQWFIAILWWSREYPVMTI